jgi:hypothetical protein
LIGWLIDYGRSVFVKVQVRCWPSAMLPLQSPISATSKFPLGSVIVTSNLPGCSVTRTPFPKADSQGKVGIGPVDGEITCNSHTSGIWWDSRFLGWFCPEAYNENTSCNSGGIFCCPHVFGVSAYSKCKLG